jgi:phenol hydroxylase P2 protein
MTTDSKVRLVGIDLQETETTRDLIDAIEADNPEATVRHMPGLSKIMAPTQLVIRRETVEQKLGRPWETHEFQLAIVSYVGNIANWDDDEIVIKWEH